MVSAVVDIAWGAVITRGARTGRVVVDEAGQVDSDLTSRAQGVGLGAMVAGENVDVGNVKSPNAPL